MILRLKLTLLFAMVGFLPSSWLYANTCADYFSSSKNLQFFKSSDFQIQPETHRLIIDALAREYDQYFSAVPVHKMIYLGESQQSVAQRVRPQLEKVIRKIEGIERTLVLPENVISAQSRRSHILNTQISIEDFASYHKLENERAYVTQMASFRDMQRVPEWHSIIDALRIAILTGQKDLVHRAFIQSVRLGRIADIAKLAIELNDMQMLLNVGRLSVTRFIFFDRNANFLKDGLNALLEVRGPLKEHAKAFLLDFSDLLANGKLLEGEKSATVRRDLQDDPAFYIRMELKVLFSASDLLGRQKRDDVSYDYKIETHDPHIQIRLRRALTAAKDQYLLDALGADTLLPAVALVGDSIFTKDLSDFFIRNYNNIRTDRDKNDLARFVYRHVMNALRLSLLANDIQHTENVLDQALTIPNHKPKFYIGADEIHLFTRESLFNFAQLLKKRVQSEKSSKTREYLASLIEITEKIELDRFKANFNFSSQGHFFPENPLVPHIRFREHTLEDPTPVERFYKPDGSLWFRFLKATEARDLPTLFDVYRESMAQGRGIDAVQIAFIIADIQAANAKKILSQGNKELNFDPEIVPKNTSK